MSDVIISVETTKLKIKTDPEDESVIIKSCIGKPHNGKPIHKMDLSPDGTYLVTYSKEDRSIVGWNVNQVDGEQLEPDITLDNLYIEKFCVSDNKELLFIDLYLDLLKIIDMANSKKIELDKVILPNHGTFNLKGELILYDGSGNDEKIILIYSTQTINNKWTCKGIFKLPEDVELISISKNDKLYFLSNNYIYEWDIRTGNAIKSILVNEKEEEEGKDDAKKAIEEIEKKMAEIDENGENEDKDKKNEDKKKKNEDKKKKNEDKKKKNEDKKNEDKMNEDKKDEGKMNEDKMNEDKKDEDKKDEDKKDEDKKNEDKKNEGKMSEDKKNEDKMNEDKMNEDKVNEDKVNEDKKKKNEENKKNKKNEKNEKNENELEKRHMKSIKITSNDKFICLKIKKKIIIYSIELAIPIEIHNDIQLYDAMRNLGFCSLLLSLFTRIPSSGIWNTIFGYCWESKNEKNLKSPILFDNKTQYWFKTLDGYVLKIKFEEKMLKEIEHTEEKFRYVNIHVFKSEKTMGAINELFQKIINESNENIIKYMDVKDQNSIKWRIERFYGMISIQVFESNKCNDSNKVKVEVYTRNERFATTHDPILLYGSKVYPNNNIVILTTKGLFIYHFNEHNKEIYLNYFYSMRLDFGDFAAKEDFSNFAAKKELNDFAAKKLKEKLQYDNEVFSNNTLPLPNDNSFKLNGWALHVINNKESLLKYGAELLTFAIKKHNIKLVKEIYGECLEYFRKDGNNRMLLSIISTAIPLLNEYYPGLIKKYSSETAMIIDTSCYNVEHRNSDLHLDSFSPNLKITKIAQFYSWTKKQEKIKKGKATKFIEEIFTREYTLTPKITFMIPYIKFVNYPQDYNDNWYKCVWDWIRPKPSPFIETIRCKEIYQTWNGEALINFKWDTYGKYYYYAFWAGFLALVICFTIATQQDLHEYTRKGFLMTTIILGSLQFTIEVRQFIYDISKWWQCFDIITYGLPVFISIYLFQTNNNRNDNLIHLISYSCLFLDLNLLLFFRVFKSYGRYFAIIISVAKRVYFFLIVFITIIMMSFAHAFYIILSPKLPYSLNEYTINDDPNNPWNLAVSYDVFENGSATGTTIIQKPDENTNMFTEYRTALFAVSSFLTGDSSALSSWSYGDNPSLVVLMVLFTFLTVIYLLNVFIGLYTEAMNDDLEAAQLMLKAELLAKIELFYLLPHQRRWKEWFPEVIYYYADVSETRDRVKNMINDKYWNFQTFQVFPELKNDLLDKLKLKIKQPKNDNYNEGNY